MVQLASSIHHAALQLYIDKKRRECHEITELLLLKEGQLGIGFKSNFPSDVSVGVVGIKHSRITSYLTKFSKGNKS